MKCENCNKNPATFHYTERQNDEIVKDVHLCEECARQKGVHHMPFSLSTVLGQLLDPQAMEGGSKVAKEMADVACPTCGMTYTEFRQKTRLGCANDYEVFRKALVPLLEKIHGGAQHGGKIPPQAGVKLVRQRELFELRRELDRHIKAEHYEDAARTRDRIKQLEVEIQADRERGGAEPA
jgi:protein arginine kinase activator